MCIRLPWIKMQMFRNAKVQRSNLHLLTSGTVNRNTVHTHLKNVHGINWTKYLDRIRKVRRGIVPDPLPQMEFFECRVCNVSVKYLKEHLRNAHKITEKEYDELFGDDNDYPKTKKRKKEQIDQVNTFVPFLVIL